MKSSKIALCICAAALVAVSAVLTANSVWDGIFIGSGTSSIYTQSGEYPMSVFFFDVGRANAVLLRCDGCNIMIDCGMEKAQADSLARLSILGIDKLDLLVLTHPDKDHIGNMSELVNTIEIDRFVTCRNGEYDITQTYLDLIGALNDNDINVEYVRAGDVLDFGDLHLSVVSPCEIYDTTNNNSVAIKAEYKDFSIFLPGDIQEEAEEDILENGADISADVLCVAHHGSGYSTTGDFLNAVNPKTAIISVEENEYLPSYDVLARLVDFGCEILRTDECGTIAVVSDGSEYKTITQFN